MSTGIEDCIAMSDDDSWYAFPRELSRGEVIGALAHESSWWDVLHGFHVKRGFVIQGLQDGEAYYWETHENDVDGIPVWIAKRRGR